VVYAPPGTATYFARTGGFSNETHLLALQLDELRTLVWCKTEDATKPAELQRFRPAPVPRPGVALSAPEPEADDDKLTAEIYLKRIGYAVDWEGG